MATMYEYVRGGRGGLRAKGGKSAEKEAVLLLHSAAQCLGKML